MVTVPQFSKKSAACKAALKLAKAGWAVFPIWHVRPDGTCACNSPARGQIGKHPRCSHGHKDATTDAAQIRRWWSPPESSAADAWQCDPESNIGIAIPDDVVIVDIDPRNGGLDTLGRICDVHGEDWMMQSLSVRSGGGGLQVYFRIESGRRFAKNLDAHFGPGIDLKQSGGYVLAPPSNHKSGGTYTWDPDAPDEMTPAPEWLLGLSSVRDEKPDVTAVPDDVAQLDDDLRARLDRAIELIEPYYELGSRHHLSIALGGYLRNRELPALAARYLVSQLPSKDPAARVRDALWAFDPGVSRPRGASDLRELAPELLTALDALGLSTKSVRDFAAKQAGRLAGTEPRFVTGNNPAEPIFAVTRTGGSASYFVLDCREGREGTYVECGQHAVHATIRETNAYGYIPTHTGGERSRKRSVADLTDQHARTIDGVEWDFARSGAMVFDPESNKMLCGVTCPEIEPRRDEAVDAWLRSIAGGDERLGALHEWIGSTRQNAIHRLATALLIIGPHGIGKSMFAVACARLWGAPVPVDLSHVVKQFNASMTACPIVADDECRTLARKLISTEDFRSLVQNRVRQFEPKNKEMRMLHGAQRFVLSTNDLCAFTFSNVLGAGAVDAIAERLLQIVITEANAPRVRSLLDACRRPDKEIDFDRFTGHFKWIQETTELPDGCTRFLGSDPNKDAARSAVVASMIEAHEELFGRIRAVFDGNRHTGQSDSILRAAGSLWVHPQKLADQLCIAGARYDSKAVRVAIGPFRGTRSCFKDGSGKTVHAVELDVLRLADALGIERAIAQRSVITAAPKFRVFAR